ncbi:bifunctional UDP-N-acetylglucosamine diphosphorylase/glucosamine-1-phosphate N-acetyltransferase GlmU [Antiquaquibacter soli]|uniref:Bifunctional protein GlmU n=1 Tax=Antiquaquibacter soli TaxID=3064523 RepID=A0ABT9BTV7_9MICO|nr:bifunctional UDP-N-acetylglucosamine diphosphorylase/glucosamine-1-phosphate N-acetyltransferase GlmU [Protaetiibacter sp. WY-16]MDO7883241.1 bifunctional UDP-N-acetylglucosamine diphosphorylase/glucosamine-1-phosphate N-acetyltransferase GlmU [Protaetiibacter sp. WY-16]
MTQNLAVVVLAAGQGTRMKSSRPKVLHSLAGRSLIGHVLATAAELSPAHIVAVVRHEREAVVATVSEIMPGAIIVDQDDVPGTGRAVEVAIEALPADFDGDVVVVSGDVPLLDAETLAALIESHRAAAASATLLSAIMEDATGYGRVIRADDDSLDRIVEQKDASPEELAVTEVNSGTYVFRLTALRSQLPLVSTQNAQGEKYLTDVIGLLRRAGEQVAAMPVADGWRVAGVNDRVQLAEAARRLNQLIVRKWQLEGVTVQDPASTWIDADVTLSPDVELLPDTQLKGATIVGEGAIIGPDTTLVDTEVGPGATVRRTDATLAVIGENATVGPWAYLRPGTYLGAGGKIGTFVETKNSTIGASSKVPHLSYIGDTTIGDHTNIGAGAITANYDDVEKHKTVIGSHVHSGSHTVFVAPVTVGDGAKTGAGTVVRKDVPPGALAITVAPQRNRENWVQENRAGTDSAKAADEASGD